MVKKNLFTPTETNVVLFDEKVVRREWHNEEWYFSIVDVIAILSQSKNPRGYWSDLKRKLILEGSTEMYEKIVQLKLQSSDGKKYPTDSANTETMLRIIQSVPSPNAEPLKQWLASLGNERLEEANDPELGIIRARERAIVAYKRKGLDADEIKRRISMSVKIVSATKEQIEQATQKPVLSKNNRLTDKQKSLRERERSAVKKLGKKK